jgi:hypothetical protein
LGWAAKSRRLEISMALMMSSPPYRTLSKRALTG